MLVIAGAVGTLCFVVIDIRASKEAKKTPLIGQDNLAATIEEKKRDSL